MNKIKKLIIEDLKKSSDSYPFIANFWKVTVSKNKKESNPINFGHYETKNNTSYPFYKPFSKIIDFSKLNDE